VRDEEPSCPFCGVRLARRGTARDHPSATAASERLGVAALVALAGSSAALTSCEARHRSQVLPTVTATPAASPTASSTDAPEGGPTAGSDEARRPVPVYGASPTVFPKRPPLPVLGALSVSEGTIPDAAHVVAAMSSSFRSCHERLLSTYPALAGRLKLAMQVDPDGAVSAASAEPLGGVPQQGIVDLGTCVAQRARQLRFQPPTSGQRVRLMVELKFPRP